MADFLEAIFTHREIVFTMPSAHQQCARALSDLAEAIAWRTMGTDEAIEAFRYEAAWIGTCLPAVHAMSPLSFH
jgi:hypothetical protein